MKTSTIPVEAPKWILIDAEGKNLGRLATQIATILRGKHKPSFSPHQLCGDHVVVINVSKLAFHPDKLHRKTYYKHTGYLGHLKAVSLDKLFAKDPIKVLELAVKGMLPKNKLRPQMLKMLHVFTEAEHTHEAQQPQPITNNK